MNKSSRVYSIYWNDVLIGIRTYLPFPNGVIKYGWRGSRLVILPDYQNLGIGTAVMEFIGELYIKKGLKYFDRSSHLRLHTHWDSSPKWEATSQNGKKSTGGGKAMWHYDNKRTCYAYEYRGEDYCKKPHIEIFCEYSENFNIEKFKKDLSELKKEKYITVITGDIHSQTPIEDVCLELGIRTQLLYLTKNGKKTILSKYKDKDIIRNW